MSEVVRKITVGVGFTTDPMYEVDKFKLEFTQEDLDKIKRIQSLIKDKVMNCGVIWFDGELLYGDEESDYRHDGLELRVFENCVYAYVQSKYTAESQYESEGIRNNILF